MAGAGAAAAGPAAGKAIALLTPGGDAVYCDSAGAARWHLDLCEPLQGLLRLPEPPHFLIPGYTATVSRWLDRGQVRLAAECYPPLRRHRPLLSALFDVALADWMVLPWHDRCDPLLLSAYREQFPQLWETHELVVRLPLAEAATSYLLCLFVSGRSRTTETALAALHDCLERELNQPYTLKVIDILKHPEQAERHHIAATPTLLRLHPQPTRRLVGGWDDPQRVLDLVFA